MRGDEEGLFCALWSTFNTHDSFSKWSFAFINTLISFEWLFFLFLPLTLLPPTDQILILLNKSYRRFLNMLRNVYDIVARYRSLGKTRLLTMLNLPCFGIDKNKPYDQEWKESCCQISRVINLVVTFSDRVLSRVLKEGGNLHSVRPFLKSFV